jgi:hypothetical protein
LKIEFTFITDIAGEHKVSIGGLVAPFETKAPMLLPPPVNGSGVAINSFSVAPSFDPATNKLIYAKIVYKTNQAWDSLDDIKLMMTIFCNGQFMEQVSLLTLSQLQTDGKTGVLDYIPPTGWEIGEYTFRAELYQNEILVEDTSFEHLTVTSESTTAVVAWKTMGIIISCVVVIGVVILTLVLYFKRSILRDYWK